MWGAVFSPLDNSFILTVDDGSFQRLVWDRHQVGLYFDDELIATERNMQPFFQKLGDLETETDQLLHKSKRNMVKEEFMIADSDTDDVFVSVSNGSLGLYHVKYPNMDHHATNKQYVDSALSAITAGLSDSDKVNKSGDTMTGDLSFDSGNSIYVNGGNIEVYDQGKIRVNKISSVGDSNFTIQRGTTTAIQIITGANKNFQKATYNVDYGVTDDLDIPHKKYVDSAIAALSSEDADLGQRIDNLTTDSVAEGSNLYYTDARVDARIDTTIDSDFLAERMPIDNLSDVQINNPTLNATDVLQWNGSVWTNSNLGISSTVVFKGSVDATTETAPAGANGDLYINTVDGTADASWTGLGSVTAGDAIVWDNDDSTWRNVGNINSGSVVQVQSGTGIEVDETDPSRPTVSVNKTVTDGWYYTQAQVDASLDSERAQNVTEHAALQASIDSNEAQNIAEHAALQASIDGIPAQVDYVTKVGYNLADPSDTTSIVLDAGDILTTATYKGNVIDNSANVIVDTENALFAGTLMGSVAGNVTTPDGGHTIISAGTDQTDGTLDIANITATGDVDFTGATVTGLPVPTDAYSKTEVDALLDSERGQSVSDDATLQTNIDAEATTRSNADSDLGVRVDTEVTDRTTADAALQASLDSEHAWNVAEHNELADSIGRERAFNVAEHDILQYNINQVSASLDSDHAWNVTEHGSINQRIDELTTTDVDEGSNLYYTDARVDARITTAIDSAFLDERMSIDNLSDVQINTPTLAGDDVLQWNGSVWTNSNIGIASTVSFKGTVDATDDISGYSTAPDAGNGDMYINTSSGTADASWVGLSTVDSGDGLVWDSDGSTWQNVGSINAASIVRVQAGTAIEVDETDPVRPTVSVRQDITDGWYYTQSQVDALFDSERSQNVTEYVALQASLDSEHAWNVTEHNTLQASIDANESQNATDHAALQASIDSEHAWNVTEHAALQANIGNCMSLNSLNQCYTQEWGVIGEGFELRTNGIITNRFFKNLYHEVYDVTNTVDPDNPQLRMMAGWAKFNCTVQASDFLDSDGNSIILTTIDAGSGGDDF
jgi:hypothetical protein